MTRSKDRLDHCVNRDSLMISPLFTMLLETHNFKILIYIMLTSIITYNFVVWYEFGIVTSLVFSELHLLCWVAIECTCIYLPNGSVIKLKVLVYIHPGD